MSAALCLDLIDQQRVTSHRSGQDQDDCLAAQVLNSVEQTRDELTQILTRYALHWKQSQTRHGLKHTWLCRSTLLTLHRQMRAAPLILLLHD